MTNVYSLFSSSLLSRFLPLAPFSSLSPSSSLPFSFLLYPPHSRDLTSLPFSLSILSSLNFLFFTPLSPFSTFLLSCLPPKSSLFPLLTRGTTLKGSYISSLSKCHCKEITCHYMVCQTHFSMTAPYSDMTLYSPCHYLVLSLYSAGIPYRIRIYRGRVTNFDQSEARKQCVLASDWSKFETLPR